MKIFKTTSVALLSGLLIGVASVPGISATVEDKVVEKIPTKGGAPSSLSVQSPVEESRTAFVGDPESCIMGDRLSIGGGHVGEGR